MSYQAVLDAAQTLYAAMFTLEQELSSRSPDANTQRAALQLSVTRLTIQKLLGVYPPPESKVAPEPPPKPDPEIAPVSVKGNVPMPTRTVPPKGRKR